MRNAELWNYFYVIANVVTQSQSINSSLYEIATPTARNDSKKAKLLHSAFSSLQ